MKLKSGDRVKVLAGKDKGKKGKILQVFVERNRASVEGVNLAIKHLRPRKQNEKGQKIEFPAPINISNLMVICPRCNKAVKIKYKYLDKTAGKKAKKVRICGKCKELID
ncbi:MAG: 50S ribosomal protein L24 [Candidatus Buchananbacteria bacterium RBG_13_39_9]|jgi:large subunit ribosomal protein L24|uniref:Large ribosomal subunit protein uL24 n=1 Tax=Candidatus Buchananbacteria bacterium RBG_13_39_9 TaxID=1797531 RepID=A0A1G1XNZ8_9BACT|nr:MAG: 50S ribosomal protein L24 [Candidatus Buchananbacteria bacterium RBG_13_39_9]